MATEASLLALMRASQGPRSAKCEQRRIDIQQHLLSELRDCKSESRVVIDDIVGASCVFRDFGLCAISVRACLCVSLVD